MIADYNLDIDYDGLELKNVPDGQEETEENSDAEYENMEIPCNGTFHQRMMLAMLLPKTMMLGET